MKLRGNKPSGGAHGDAHKINVTEIRSDAAAPAAQRPKKKRRGRYVLGAAVLLIAALLLGYSIWERPPEILPPAPSAAAQPAAPDDPRTPVDPSEPVDPGEAPDVSFSSERRDGVYTMLLVGRDFASNSTDTILVGSFDTVAHRLSFVSLPRDTLINIKWSGTPKKINAVFPGYTNSGESGIEGLKTHVKNLLGFDVDCYAVVSLEAVEQAVDAIGGVWFDVPQDMYYYDFAQDLVIEIPKGYQLLDGENTLKLCRFRDGYAGGDLERIGVQQALLTALAKQMLSLGNIPNLSALIDILVQNVDTDLSAANLAWFARQFLLCSMDNVHFLTAPIGSGAYINGVSFVSLDAEQWLALVNEQLNPYKDAVTPANVNLLSCNSTGTRVTATNGMIAGGDDSFYCLPCTVANGGKSVHHLPGACPKEAPPAPEVPEAPEAPEAPPAEEQPETPTEPAEGELPQETPEIIVVPPEAEFPIDPPAPVE